MNKGEIMTASYVDNLFDLSGNVAVVTGGAGILCATLCRALSSRGVKIAILDINLEASTDLAKEINGLGGRAIALKCNVCEKESILSVSLEVINSLGSVDFLINGAGGNNSQATTSPDLSFFDLPEDALKFVFDLNLLGTIFVSQVFGKIMAGQKRGTILNISSMNAIRPLTRIPAYSAAKAAVSNFTQWLAVYMAQEYSPKIRVNAIAPGFFLTEQNRYLLTKKETGEFTERGHSIIQHTPMQRFGVPEDLVGAVNWLLSPASNFVTGVVIPIDGGFSAFSGV